MLHWSEPQLCFGVWGFLFFFSLPYGSWVCPCSVSLSQGPLRLIFVLVLSVNIFTARQFPPIYWAKNDSIFVVTTREAPVGAGSMVRLSVVSERGTLLLSSALLWSSFDWKYFACLTTCWWIFLCQVMCQELAEHSKLITYVHTVKEKQTARHQWYEEWDFIAVARDCVVNESAQSAGNW